MPSALAAAPSVQPHITPLRERLASSARVLIIDDNPRAGEIAARELSGSFAVVEHTASALAGLEKIRAARAAGIPYDAVVLDLLMPEMNGLTLLSQLGDDITAVVIHTASTMAPEVLDLHDELSGQRALERIFVHHKQPGSVERLQEKIDEAVACFTAAPEAAVGFYRSFRPRFREREPGVEEVHNFCEEARNLCEELSTMLKYLRDEHRLGETPWWRGQGRTALEEAIARVGAAHQSNTWRSTPGATDDALHQILNVMALELSLPALSKFPELARNARSAALFEEWGTTVERYYGLCKGLRDGFKRHYGKSFYLEDFLPEVWPAGIELPSFDYFGEDESRKAALDPERRIRNLLPQILRVFGEAVKEAPESKAGAIAYHHPEDGRIGEEITERARLKRIDAGGYWELCISADDIDLEKLFERFAPQLAVLVENKDAAFDVSLSGERRGTPGGARSYFSLLLKTSPSAIDLDAREAEIARELLRKKEDGSYIIPRDRRGHGLWVCEGLGKDGNIVCVYNTPQNRAEEKWFGPVIYREGETVIYCDYMGHPLGAKLIVEYLRHVRTVKGEPLGWLEGDEAEEAMYRKVLRLNRDEEANFVIDAWPDSKDEAFAREVLTQLGVPPGKVTADKNDFARKLDPSWFQKNRRIERGEGEVG